MDRTITTVEDVLRLLDAMFEDSADRWSDRGARWWDGFYDDRGRGVPFFRPAPDESLVGWHRAGALTLSPGGRALDLGCGPGRNAVWLAQHGYLVDAVDLSAAALDWARERAEQAGVEVRFIRASIFDDGVAAGEYDLVYDSGCFHHLPPHRRVSYHDLVARTLAPGGAFALACFAEGAMGSEAPDQSFYREGTLGGGLAYGADDLRRVFGWLDEVELRRMCEMPPDSELFGEAFLWAGLWRQAAGPQPTRTA